MLQRRVKIFLAQGIFFDHARIDAKYAMLDLGMCLECHESPWRAGKRYFRITLLTGIDVLVLNQRTDKLYCFDLGPIERSRIVFAELADQALATDAVRTNTAKTAVATGCLILPPRHG